MLSQMAPIIIRCQTPSSKIANSCKTNRLMLYIGLTYITTGKPSTFY